MAILIHRRDFDKVPLLLTITLAYLCDPHLIYPLYQSMEGIRMNQIIHPIKIMVALALLCMPGFIIGCTGPSAHRITSPAGTTTTYILVRHAEKESNDVASPLTDKGRE